MFQQTKVNEKTRPLIVSYKERENCICQNVQNLSYWNRYFVIYPHKCTLNNLKKKYQEKWENAYMTVKNARASRALRQALDPGHYWLTSLAQLHFATLAKSQKKFLGPPWPNPGSASDIHLISKSITSSAWRILLENDNSIDRFFQSILSADVEPFFVSKRLVDAISFLGKCLIGTKMVTDLADLWTHYFFLNNRVFLQFHIFYQIMA